MNTVGRPEGHLAKPVQFYGPDGAEMPSWQVPLEQYVEAHAGLPNNWARAHKIVVARALVHDYPVPAEVLAGHDPVRLARTVEFEREAHRQAAHLCPECGTRAGEEE